jgi:RNA polymerase sigma-70 factor (sigma-E family)
VEQKREEFSEFYTSVKDDCLRIVLVSVGDRQLAEDLVAEAFTRAWASWRTVRVHPVPHAWVVRTALNTHVSWWRRRRREVAVPDGPGQPEPEPAMQSWSTVLDKQLASVVRTLPPRQREVLALRVLCDLDTDETARLLGIAPGTVGVHLHRALATLRTQIPSFTDREVTP